METKPAYTWAKELANNSLAIVIVLFLMVVGYRYLELKLEQMSDEFNYRLQDKIYEVAGEILVNKEDPQKPVKLNLEIKATSLPAPRTSAH